MTHDSDNWTDDFLADCLNAANKAEKRSINLSALGVITTLLGSAYFVIWVVIAVRAHDSQSRFDVAASLAVFLGIFASFVVTAVVLFAAASVVEIAGKRLRLDVMAATDRELVHNG
jgi:hypothetical protein